MTLRLASYNVHKCLGTDRLRSPGRILSVINRLGADVVALQEADMRLGTRPTAIPVEMIEAETDFIVAPLGGTAMSLGWHGNAVLVRRGLDVSATHRFALPGLEPRGAVAVDVEGKFGAVRVVATHLGLIRRYRLMQLAAIRAQLDALQARPVAILGDFNEWSRSRGMEPLSDKFRIHAPGLSFHANRPMAALDRVALSFGLHLRDAGVEQGTLARSASDHLPIWADVRLDTPSGAGG